MTATYAPPGASPAGPPQPAAPPARRSSPAPQHDVSRTWLALLASGLGILPLDALFRDSGWLWDAWLTMLIVVGPAAVLRRTRAASALQIWLGVVLLIPWLTLRFVHQHALAGVLPGPGTWHDIHLLFVSLHHTTTSEVAPVHTTVAVRFVVSLLFGLVAALIDLTAVVARHGALAGVPLLVIFTVSGAVPRTPVSWPLFVLAAIAFLILLGLDSRDDLQRWGHYVPRSGQAGRRAAGALSAQRIAAGAVLLAVLVPVFIQSDSRNLIANAFHNGSAHGSGSFGAGGTGGIDPFVSLTGQLTRTHPVSLLKVTVEHSAGTGSVAPFYGRLNVLSDYTGAGWQVAGRGASESLDQTRFESSPGTPQAPDTASFKADITVTGLTSDPPVFVQPVTVSGLDSDTRWNPQDQLLIGGTTQRGEKYDVTFNQPNPTAAELNAANTLDPALTPWLQLPRIASSVQTLVSTLTANASTQYEKTLAINNYFTNPANGFVYSLATRTGDSGDALVDFLQNKIGFCQQYAAAEAVMLRLAKVPSRVVLGYTHQPADKSGSFTITTDDAHSWVEAYFSGIGWVPFDPTPIAGISGGAASDLPWAPHAGVKPLTTPSGQSSGPTNSVTLPPRRLDTSSSSVSTTVSSSSGSSGGITSAVVGGILVVLLAAGLTPSVVRRRRRRQRLLRGRGGDPSALWDELNDTATDLGFVWSDARSPRQVASWLCASAGTAAPRLEALADAVEQQRYAPPGSAGADGPALARDYAEVSTQLRAGRARRDQLRARFLPASLGWTARLPRRRH